MPPIQHWLKTIHNRPERDQPSYWQSRTWVGDNHRFRDDGKPLLRPSYRAGDLLLIYLTGTYRCPAAVRVVDVPDFDPARVDREERAGDGSQWGWVTAIEVLAHTQLVEAPTLDDVGVETRSLMRRGRLKISATQFEAGLSGIQG